MPFQGSSSYKEQFKEYLIEPLPAPQFSQSIPKHSQVKFEGHTTYRDEFKKFKVIPE